MRRSSCCRYTDTAARGRLPPHQRGPYAPAMWPGGMFHAIGRWLRARAGAGKPA